MFSLLALAALAAVTQSYPDCEFTAERSANVAVASSDFLDLIARSGSLVVEGRPGVAEVRIRGRACASSESLLERLVIETGRSGGRVRVDVPEMDWDDSFFGNRYASLDLVIEVPEGMAANIDDGSGEAEIRGVGPLRITDGSGELRLIDIRGDVTIDDGSGEVEIAQVDGDVIVEDGSGQLDIRDVTGSVTIDDGSGSIAVSGVRGDFVVRDDGSGGISHDNVAGTVDIPLKDRARRRRR